MTTLATLKAEIASDLDRTDLTSDIATAVTKAIEFYQEKPFWFQLKRDVAFDTVAAQDIYSGSDDGDIARLIEPSIAVLTDGTNTTELDRVSSDMLEATLAASGRPTCYSWYDEAIRLHPIPNAVYSILITGQVATAAPAADDEADNPWMTYSYDLIRSRAVADLSLRKTRDYEFAKVMKAMEKDEYNQLKRKTARKIGTGKITPTQF